MRVTRDQQHLAGDFCDQIAFYHGAYDVIGSWLFDPAKKIILGDPSHRRCRFCHRGRPAVTFRMKAHAIPELLGNKSITSYYECDSCNKMFGDGIENDLGNWSKPMRTLQRIRGKNGVPVLRTDAGSSRMRWDTPSHFSVNHLRDDGTFTVNVDAKTLTFHLRRDPFTPLGVLKALVKIGISLQPEEEMPNFQPTVDWLTGRNSQLDSMIVMPVHRTFTPGVIPKIPLSAALLRRKSDALQLPYSFLLLSASSEQYQVMLPSPERDPSRFSTGTSLPPFPGPAAHLGLPSLSETIDLRGTDRKFDDRIEATMTFEDFNEVEVPNPHM